MYTVHIILARQILVVPGIRTIRFDKFAYNFLEANEEHSASIIKLHTQPDNNIKNVHKQISILKYIVYTSISTYATISNFQLICLFSILLFHVYGQVLLLH